MKKSYNETIKKNAESNGYKSANLSYLKDNLSNYKTVSGLQVAVPKFVSLSHDQVLKHLNENCSSWKNSWSEFVKIFNNQRDKKSLGDNAKKILEQLRNEIKKTFVENHIINENENLTQNLDKSDLLMVRSTGKEDSVELANPGGNESVPSEFNNKAISNAVGEVVASYFSEKSLSQRLKADNDITVDPFMPVLIQNLVGEGLSNQDGIVYSGVMYSGDGNTKIQVAPGHGELIVNSKGNFDDFYVTSQNVVYGEVQNKDFRLKPNYNETTKKLSLQEVDNKSDTAVSHSLPEAIVQEMHNLAQEIEKLYGMRMDVEFVYDPSSKVLNIVQARPIPDGDRVNHKPSALDPFYIKEIIKDGGQIFKGSTITPEVNHAVTIDDVNQIIIYDRIDEALSAYLKNSKNIKNSENIKAVVVKNKAPNTGHEAGEFSSKAIPVVQISNIDNVKKLLEDLKEGKKIVVDPQRKSVFQLPAKPNTETVIKEGIFKSALTSNVSSYKYEFVESTSKETGVLSKNLPNKLGDLITSAKKGEVGAFEKLAKQIHDNYLNGNKLNPRLGALIKALEILENPYGKTDGHQDALKIVLKLAANLYRKGEISKDLFVQTMISGAELGNIITGSLKGIDEQLFINIQDKQKIYSEYLNVFEKLEGTIKSEPEKDVISSSVFTELSEKRHEKKMLLLVKDKILSQEQKANFVNVTKLAKFFINKESQENYINFCKEICATQYSNQLVILVVNIVKMGVQAQWCNTSFVKTYKEHSKESLVIFVKMLKEAKIIMEKKEDLKQIDRAINQLKKQVGLWKEPKDFDELHKQFQEKLGQIKEKLKINKQASALEIMVTSKQMNDLVESIDLTIKSLEKSTIYTNKTQQAYNFKLLLKDFAGLMSEWFKDAQIENGAKIQEKIVQMLQSKPTEQDLSPSGTFAVNTATINSNLTDEGWGRNLVLCKTLEDCFTLIHQNMICVISNSAKNSNSGLLDELPETLKELHTKLVNTEKYKANIVSIELTYPQTTIHYNIPLRNHSALADIKYDCLSKETSIVYSVFGNNWDNRWNKLELYSLVQFNLLSDVEMVQNPKFQNEKNILSFEVKIKDVKEVELVNNVINYINIQCTDNSNFDLDIFNLIKFIKIDNFKWKKFLESIDLNFINIFEIGLVKFLIEKGADLNVQDKDGKTALYISALQGKKEIVELLIQSNVDLNVQDKDRKTALHIAALKGNKEIAELLIKNKVDLNVQDKDGKTPLHIVSQEKEGETRFNSNVIASKKEIAELLVENDANLNVQDKDGKTPLHIAALKKGLFIKSASKMREEIIELLVKKGANLDVKDNEEKTALHVAVEHCSETIVGLLINNENLNLQDKEGKTPLHLAVIFKDVKMVELLIEKGATLDVVNKDGDTPITIAINKRLTNVAKLLIEKGATLDVVNKEGYTPLTLAISRTLTETAKLLIEKNTNLDVVNKKGETALHYLIRFYEGRKDMSEMVELLLKKGAKFDIKDDSGKTAYELAKNSNNTTILNLLEKANSLLKNEHSDNDTNNELEIELVGIDGNDDN